MTEGASEQQRCPLCGAENQCAIAANRPAESCWCMNVTISQAALDAIPEEFVNKRCICAGCGTVKGESDNER